MPPFILLLAIQAATTPPAGLSRDGLGLATSQAVSHRPARLPTDGASLPDHPEAEPAAANATGTGMSLTGADDFDVVDNLGRNDMSPGETERIADRRAAAAARIDSLGGDASNRRGAGTSGSSPASPRRPPN